MNIIKKAVRDIESKGYDYLGYWSARYHFTNSDDHRHMYTHCKFTIEDMYNGHYKDMLERKISRI